ncbi:MAG: hypothetical protein V4629_02865 [Pseudomonadota bacterium]
MLSDTEYTAIWVVYVMAVAVIGCIFIYTTFWLRPKIIRYLLWANLAVLSIVPIEWQQEGWLVPALVVAIFNGVLVGPEEIESIIPIFITTSLLVTSLGLLLYIILTLFSKNSLKKIPKSSAKNKTSIQT